MCARPLLSAVLLSMLLASSGPAPGQGEAAKKFAGTWEAKFQGAVFSVLKIQAEGKITGSLSAGSIDIDQDGNLLAAKPSDDEYPLLGPRIEGDTLIFEWTDDPDDPPLKFELRLTGSQEAQLRFLTTPNHARIKPFTYARRG